MQWLILHYPRAREHCLELQGLLEAESSATTESGGRGGGRGSGSFEPPELAGVQEGEETSEEGLHNLQEEVGLMGFGSGGVIPLSIPSPTSPSFSPSSLSPSLLSLPLSSSLPPLPSLPPSFFLSPSLPLPPSLLLPSS